MPRKLRKGAVDAESAQSAAASDLRRQLEVLGLGDQAQDVATALSFEVPHVGNVAILEPIKHGGEFLWPMRGFAKVATPICNLPV